MPNDRLEQLEKLRQSDPANTLTLYMIVNELYKAERWNDVVTAARDYLAKARDEGSAYRLLGHALDRLGRRDEAKAAFLEGAAVAESHRHTGMAEEFRDAAASL
jgi:Flp pilus assembly protein TadD